jgi:phosphatidylglycerol:prolipoprotein diacylglycerol transferase
MMIHPQFDPIALSIGPLSIHWYGIMYLIAFILFYLLGRYRIHHTQLAQNWTIKQLDDLLFYGVLGVVIGGRLGYVFLYKPGEYLAHPIEILKIWEAGMSFHGGLLGVLIAMYYFCRQTQRSFLAVSDFVAPLVPLGLAFGRLGNFINGELWGRITSADAPWAMIFPQSGDTYPRHPSQLYEMGAEGIGLFFILWFFSRQARPTGQISGLFLLGYGIARFGIEFTREPDYFLGLLAYNLTMGQWLSLPMIVIGGILLLRSGRAHPSL